MMKKPFFSRRQSLNDNIIELTCQRDQCAERIRTLRSEMDSLVDHALTADDLEQKILSLDYEAKKLALNAEYERFSDLNQLITRYRSAQLMTNNSNGLAQVAAMGEKLDMAGLQARGDAIRIRRDMLNENAEQLWNMTDSPMGQNPEPFKVCDEFAARMAQAQQKRSS